MIFDCFTFYKEMDMLEIRLNILNEVVDKFILVESTVTYTNKKKPLYYSENKDRYKKFHNKIIHVIVRDTPDVSNPWLIEHHLMASIKKGLTEAKPNDTILISNLDEIPNPKKIIEYKDKSGKLKAFDQNLFYYYLNYTCVNKRWVGTKMLSYKNFTTYADAYVIRHSPNDVLIKNGGWHFSFMGGLNYIREKIATGTHQEYNNDKYNTKEKIMRAIIEKRDMFDHGEKYDFFPINQLPQYIYNNMTKYPDFFLDKKNISIKKSYITYLELKHNLRIAFRKIRRKFS